MDKSKVIEALRARVTALQSERDYYCYLIGLVEKDIDDSKNQ